jgi:transposase InsO family protein
MDFIMGLPRTKSGYDSIWVVVDCLTKVAHFIPVKTTYTSAKLSDIYMKRIVCLHGVPKSIVSDRGTQFTSHFWKQLHETLGTRLEFSTAFHPQTDGQTERVNQVLEDMLRACALDYGSSWDDNLPYAALTTTVIKLVSKWLHSKLVCEEVYYTIVMEWCRRTYFLQTRHYPRSGRKG